MILATPFLFIGTTEVVFILFIVVMVFGADKLPEIARGLGKGMSTLKNATDEIKHEITKSAQDHGIDSDVTSAISEEVKKVKDDIEEVSGTISRGPK